MDHAATPTPPVPLGWAIVTGDSMLPTLRADDRLLVCYRRTPRPGQVVVARFPDGTLTIKRAVERRPSGWWLLSDNPVDGVDSRHRGPIADQNLHAVAVFRVWPRPGRIRSAPSVT